MYQAGIIMEEQRKIRKFSIRVQERELEIWIRDVHNKTHDPARLYTVVIQQIISETAYKLIN